MKIVDCFIFYNELDLLNYRLNILDSKVDHFVLVEATHTFTGKEKPLIFIENLKMFEKFADKITHIVVDMPYKYPDINYEKNEQWANEYHQRNSIDIGIKSLDLKEEDLIIITDVDEILNPILLNNIRNDDSSKMFLENEIVSLEMDLYYYNLLTLDTIKWSKPKILSFNLYKSISQNKSCDNIRMMSTNFKYENAGWHLSYFGDIEFIKNKLCNISHQECNIDKYTSDENISKSIETGNDMFHRKNSGLSKIELNKNPNLPYEYEKYLQKFYKKT